MDFAQSVQKTFGIDATLIYGGWFFLFMDCALPLIMLLGHFTRRIRPLPLYLVVGSLVIPIYQALSLILLESVNWKAHLAEILSYTGIYGVALYVILCEWLMRGRAQKFTDERGEHWTKEIEYLYLAIGAFAVVGTIIKSEAYVERAWLPGTLSGILLTTALVLRLIKTRAEVSGWNKTGVSADPQGDKLMFAEEARRASLKENSEIQSSDK